MLGSAIQVNSEVSATVLPPSVMYKAGAEVASCQTLLK
jgi:hypothetical protein